MNGFMMTQREYQMILIYISIMSCAYIFGNVHNATGMCFGIAIYFCVRHMYMVFIRSSKEKA